MRTVRTAARWPAREERFEHGWNDLGAARLLLAALAQQLTRAPDAILADALAEVREQSGADALALFSPEERAESQADGRVPILRRIASARGPLELPAERLVAPGESLAAAAGTAATLTAATAVEVALAAPDAAEPAGWLVALYAGDDADERATRATAGLEQVAWPFTLALRSGWRTTFDGALVEGMWPGIDPADRTLCGMAWQRIDETPSSAGAAGSEPGTETQARAVDENVQFTVYRPRRLAPEVWSTVLAFAHLAERRDDADADEPDPVAEVQRQARQVLGDEAAAFSATTEDSGDAIPREGDLTFALTLPGMQVNPPRRSFRWVEDVHREEFRIRAPATLQDQTVRGELQVYLGALLVAEIALAVRIDASASRPAAAETEADRGRPYRRIFPSYSHRDEAIVRQVEAYARTMGDEYLRDVTHLRAGEAWGARLRDFIRDADVFQLFWSRNSMASPYVRQEWEYALSLGRPHFVRPTYWETPLPEAPDRDLPPPTLRALHFQRLPLAVEEAEPAAQPPAAPAPQPPPPPEAPPHRIDPVAPPRVDVGAAPAPGRPPAPASARPPASRTRRFRFPTAIAALLVVGFLGGTIVLRQGLPTAGTSTPDAPAASSPGSLRALSPDGERVASMDDEGRIRVAARSDPEASGIVIATKFRPADVASLRFSPDGRRIICAMRDGTTVEWDARTGARLAGAAGPRSTARRSHRWSAYVPQRA